MKRPLLLAVASAAGLLSGALPALAHHAVGAEFDVNKTVNLSGTVVEVEWFNPHIWIYLDVEESDGTTARYQCEGSSPNSLMRRGWRRDSLKPGDRVEITGLEARRDPYTCYTRSISLADGIRLFSGNASELEAE